MPLVVPGIMSEPSKNNDNKGPQQAKATAQDHNANPGPAIPQDTSVFENPASREEMKARAEELNNKENKTEKKD